MYINVYVDDGTMIWDIVDSQAYVSISHWGMFPVGPAHPCGVDGNGKG